jgi:hypothetical protein
MSQSFRLEQICVISMVTFFLDHISFGNIININQKKEEEKRELDEYISFLLKNFP